MYALLIVIHIIACLILIATILLQSGRGGGLSEMFGQASTQTIFGTRTSTFLTRITTASAIAFLLTCISLTILSSGKFRSLMAGVKQEEKVKEEEQKLPQSPAGEEGKQETKEEKSEPQAQVPQEQKN